MISTIYCDVQNPRTREALVCALYNIAQKVPNFKSEFPDVFSTANRDPYEWVRELARDGEAVMMITSAGSVDAINEIFWDQSLGVKKELLGKIRWESMINAETAEVAMEMALNFLEGSKHDGEGVGILVLLSVTRFLILSNKTLHRLLDPLLREFSGDIEEVLEHQPLDRLIEYFLDTNDKRITWIMAPRFLMAPVTYKAVRGGKSIVSVIDKGKKTELEAPTESVKKLVCLVKDYLRKYYVDMFFETRDNFLLSSIKSIKRSFKLRKKQF